MKKVLLIALASVLAVAGASAQAVKRSDLKRKATAAVPTLQDSKAIDVNRVEVREAATEAQVKANRAARKAEAKPVAWYGRPAGTFFRGIAPSGGLYYNPVIIVPPYEENTFPNQSTNASEYAWTFSTWQGSGTGYVEQTSTDFDYTVETVWGEGSYAPTLTATNTAGANSYQLFNNYVDDESKESTIYQGLVYSMVDPADEFSSADNEYTFYNVSPKFWAAGDRDGGYGAIRYTGAADEVGGTSGNWFGRNWDERGFNAMAVRFEKPNRPYAVRSIQVSYNSLKLVDEFQPVELQAKIYSVKQSTDTLELGEVLAQGIAVLNEESKEYGMLQFPLMIYEDDLEYEEPLTVDQEIAVVVTGYDDDNISSFSMVISTDEYDEGHGYLGYMIRADADGEPYWARELENFFRSPLGNQAPSIFLDVEMPLLMFNYTAEEGEVEFPVEGGEVERNWKTSTGAIETQDYVNLFTNHPCTDFYPEYTEDGSELPEWLKVSYEDQFETAEDGTTSFANVVELHIKAEALPADIAGREVTFYVNFPGAYLPIHVIQGEVESGDPLDVNGDGEVNVGDVNYVLNIVLAEKYDANADVNGDGSVNVGDVNVILNAILK